MRVVVSLSGGLDSTVLLAHHLEQGDEVRAISFDYGQRHRRELDWAQELAGQYGVPHTLVRVDLAAVTRSALTGHGSVPHGHYAHESMKQTVVPSRNATFVCLASALAISHDMDAVSIAAHAGDHAIYPDCRPMWMQVMQQAVRMGNWGASQFELLAPFVLMTKHDIVVRGDLLGAPMHKSWSCYEGGAIHCGRCGTCVERREAFELAGVPDHTEYASGGAA